MLSRVSLLLTVLLCATPAVATELVRVRVSQFSGTEPLSISSASHPALFVLDPSIASVELTADNPGAPIIEDNGPATWFPAMAPASVTAVAGTIELTITPVSGMPVSLGLIRFRTEARFPANPSSFVFASSLDAFATPLAVIDLAAALSTTRFLSAPASDAPTTFRWTAGDDFGDNGGGESGFSGEDIVVATTPCTSSPAPGCASPGRSSLSLDADPSQRLSWSWLLGSAALDDFGDPSTETLLALCLYDDGALTWLASLGPDLCGSKPCWKTQSSGFSYKNKSGGQSGITSLKLKAGDGKASIALKGAGSQLDLPLPLDAATSVRAQLVRSDGGACFEADYPAPAETDTALEFEDSIP